MSLIGKWLYRNLPKADDIVTNHEDRFKAVDESLRLLQTTTAEVSQAAIAAAHHLQDRLNDSERRFFSTIDTIEDLVIIKDGNGRWKSANIAAQNAFDMHHGEYYDKTDVEIAHQYPSLHNSMVVCVASDNLAWTSMQACRTQECFSTPGKPEQYYDVIKTPVFNADHSRKEMIIIGRNITDAIERNRRTKACFEALNSASDIIFIADKKGDLFFCNDKFLEHFNIAKYDDVVGRIITDVIPNIDDYDQIWYTISQNKTWYGHYNAHYRMTIVPVMNGAPAPIYYVYTIKPI